jgi:tetratricopeptide (TPR) repeat protein
MHRGVSSATASPGGRIATPIRSVWPSGSSDVLAWSSGPGWASGDPRVRKRRLTALFSIVLALAATPSPGSGRLPPGEQARLLNGWAAASIDSGTAESRARAIRDLEDATRLDPDNPEHWRLLGTAHAAGRHFALAHDAYRHAVAVAPNDPDSHFLLGMEWRREWLLTLDPALRDRAIAEFETVIRLRPSSHDAWLRIAPLLYERHEISAAAAAAERALPGRWVRTVAMLEVAYLSFRVGDVDRADTMFQTVMPRLAPSLRMLFDDPGSLAHTSDAEPDPHDTGDGSAAAPPARRAAPWSSDPAPATIEYEARLEYWSRVAHAYALFDDPLEPGLDGRAETYARYGPPTMILQNPMGIPNEFRPILPEHAAATHGSLTAYPFEVQMWTYPDYGMRVLLADRNLNGRYSAPTARYDDPFGRPNPALLAGRHDLIVTGDGAVVLPAFPPRDQRLEVLGRVLRFEGEQGPRLMVQVETPGAPDDTVRARWTVIGADGRPIVTDTGALVASTCDPASRREGQFAAALVPGAARVAVSVQDTHHHRGRFEDTLTVRPPPGGLHLSDVVVSCGDPSLLIGGHVVRIGVNVEGRVETGRQLILYFEIYGLATGSDGNSQFAYECDVLPPAAPGEHGDDNPLATTAREEVQPGALRRQFVAVPVERLFPGPYRVRLRVHDRIAGVTATGFARFVRE